MTRSDDRVLSINFLRHVRGLSPQQQLRKWGSRSYPWVLGGKRVKLTQPEEVGDRHVTVDGQGHITRLTRPIYRPCFGWPTAYLIHGGERWTFRRDGKPVPTRCAACNARVACEYVAKRRIRIFPDVRHAHDEWEEAGGRNSMLDKKNRHGSRAGHRWAVLIQALEGHLPFHSVVDEMIDNHLADYDEKQREKDRDRRRDERERERAEQRARGEFSIDVLNRLENEARRRRELYGVVLGLDECPRELAKGSADTGIFTSQVWQMRTLLLMQGKAPNPSIIATMLIERRLVVSTNQNAVRVRAKRALDRINRLEHFTPTGWSGPAWPALDLDWLMEDFDPPII